MKGRVLVTGGLGYIGSHTSVELLAQGYEVLLVDNLSNTRAEVLDGIEAISGKRPEWLQVDLSDSAACRLALEGQHFDGIIHFAAYKAVGESVAEPLKYYQNNLFSLINLLDYVSQHPQLWLHLQLLLHRVWPSRSNSPSRRDAPIKAAESPYGNTKQIGEEIIRETALAAGLENDCPSLFQPHWGPRHPPRLGELPLGVPQNLGALHHPERGRTCAGP